MKINIDNLLFEEVENPACNQQPATALKKKTPESLASQQFDNSISDKIGSLKPSI